MLLLFPLLLLFPPLSSAPPLSSSFLHYPPLLLFPLLLHFAQMSGPNSGMGSHPSPSSEVSNPIPPQCQDQISLLRQVTARVVSFSIWP